MKRIRILGLCLVAAFSLAIVMASSASAALPEVYECHKLTVKPFKGKFTDKKCTKAATKAEEEAGKTNKYELQPGIGKGKVFKGKGGKATLHTPAVGGEVTCGGFKDEGKLTSPTEQAKVLSIFTKCVSLGKNCSSPAAKKGEIKTHLLKGTLGYISKTGPKVGVALQAETGSILAEFNCEGLEISVTGSVIGEQTGNINVFNKTTSDVFKVNGEDLQEPNHFEGEAPKSHVLLSLINGSGPFESGQEATAVNKGEELEVKA
jgi:hypothetical protein